MVEEQVPKCFVIKMKSIFKESMLYQNNIMTFFFEISNYKQVFISSLMSNLTGDAFIVKLFFQTLELFYSN